MTAILVVNPNTTASMTLTIAAAARLVAAPGTEIIAATSSMGPASIEGYYDEAFALPGLLREIAAAERAGAEAAVIACFDDTGLDAARAMAQIPVIGICEAALSTAAFIAQRFTVVTTANIAVLALEDPNSGARDKLRNEIVRALSEDNAEAIVLGCAGMADLARTLSGEFGLPVIDGVGAAVKQAEALVALGLRTSKRGAYAAPLAKPYAGALKEFAPA